MPLDTFCAALPFFFTWDTKFNGRTGYRDIYLFLKQGCDFVQNSECPIEFIQILAECLEKMDEQIYTEYRELGNRLKVIMDAFLKNLVPNDLYSTALFADAALRLSNTVLLPERLYAAGDALLSGALKVFAVHPADASQETCAALYLALAQRDFMKSHI